MSNCFLPARILLPGAEVPLDPWACIAVDQFTSQPEYWQQAERLAAGRPSTLQVQVAMGSCSRQGTRQADGTSPRNSQTTAIATAAMVR